MVTPLFKFAPGEVTAQEAYKVEEVTAQEPKEIFKEAIDIIHDTRLKYEPFIPPIEEVPILLIGEDKKKPRKRKKRYRREEYPWKEKHYIPTLQELMRPIPGMKVSKPMDFEPKMPKLPKGIM